MTSPPLISVLMTAYNRAQYIAEAIESVLSSSLEHFELIIVDDVSADSTVDVAQRYAANDKRVRVYVNDKNLGDYPNRNKAASYATGKYIKYLDSDDYIYPHGLQVMYQFMESFTEAGYGLAAISSDQHHYPVCLSPRETYLEHFNGYGHFDRAPGSSIIRRDAFEKTGGFSGKRMIGDHELWFKLSRYFSMVKLPRDLVWDRIHAGQESRSDYANEYTRLRKEIMEEALKHPDCPLNENEKKEILSKQRKNLAKQIIKRWL